MNIHNIQIKIVNIDMNHKKYVASFDMNIDQEDLHYSWAKDIFDTGSLLCRSYKF